MRSKFFWMKICGAKSFTGQKWETFFREEIFLGEIFGGKFWRRNFLGAIFWGGNFGRVNFGRNFASKISFWEEKNTREQKSFREERYGEQLFGNKNCFDRKNLVRKIWKVFF